MNRDMHHVAEPGKFEIEIADYNINRLDDGEVKVELFVKVIVRQCSSELGRATYRLHELWKVMIPGEEPSPSRWDALIAERILLARKRDKQ